MRHVWVYGVSLLGALMMSGPPVASQPAEDHSPATASGHSTVATLESSDAERSEAGRGDAGAAGGGIADRAVTVPASIDHHVWDQLLGRYVRKGLVDYHGVQGERHALDAYVAGLGDVDPTGWPPAEQLAFWINAYNACVIQGVLDRSPLTSVKSVRGFFDSLRYRVAGRELTLDEIEAEGHAREPMRIHFALVCAAVSCPPLRAEAYHPDRIEAQLTEQLEQFLRDADHGLRLEESTLWVSKIVDWYTEDFVSAEARGGSRRLTAEQLLLAFSPYLAPDVAQEIRQRMPTVKFLKYDWSLNEQGGGG